MAAIPAPPRPNFYIENIDPADWQSKAFHFVNVEHDPLCIDIAQEEQDKDQPHVWAYPANDGYKNQAWSLHRFSMPSGDNVWSIQNVGTGLYLSHNPNVDGYITSTTPSAWIIKIIKGREPGYQYDGKIFFYPMEATGRIYAAILKDGKPGTPINVEASSAGQLPSANKLWYAREHQVSSEDLGEIERKRRAVEKKEAEEAAAAAAKPTPAPIPIGVAA